MAHLLEERLLRRKPLLPTELAAEPATVCVTGGDGYIGCAVVARLLAAGHTVHATTWSPSAPGTGTRTAAVWPTAGDKPAALGAVAKAMTALPGAADRLRWFAADLAVDGSFDAAMAGCKYVIHTAAPVPPLFQVPPAWKETVEPTLRGVRCVLASVNRTPSVEKVVFTSSQSAVYSTDYPRDHVFTDDDLNLLAAAPRATPYLVAKSLAEWEAWAIAGQQKRWQLVVMCPAVVLGPPIVPNYRPGSTVASIQDLLSGKSWPLDPNGAVGFVTVDLADVAAAHVAAMASRAAHGRYLLAERGVSGAGVARELKKQYPEHRVPTKAVPAWILKAFARLAGAQGSVDWVNARYHERRFDCGKALRDLGLGAFIPLERTLGDTAEAMFADGVVARRGAKQGGEAKKAA